MLTRWKVASANEYVVMDENRNAIAEHFRYRDSSGAGPHDYMVDIQAPSIKEAKRIGKTWEGREDCMRWFMGLYN